VAEANAVQTAMPPYPTNQFNPNSHIPSLYQKEPPLHAFLAKRTKKQA
jgi:hypothetical protein